MAIQFNFGTGARGTPINKSVSPWSYVAAFRATQNQSGRARMIVIKTDLDKPTSLVITNEKIANVYTTLTSVAVPVDNQSLNVEGTTVRVELRTIATKADGLKTIHLPLECDIRVRIPNDAELTAADMDTLVSAAYAGLLDASGQNMILSDLARGALTPAGV